MIYYILTLALGALCWSMWSYTAHREIKTLRSDLVASQVALDSKEEELSASTTSSRKAHKLLSEYDAAVVAYISWVSENAKFDDINEAITKYDHLFDLTEKVAKKYKKTYDAE